MSNNKNIKLTTTSNLSRPDDVYEALIYAQNNISVQQSLSFNAKLILLLANHIGDADIIIEAIEKAKKNAH